MNKFEATLSWLKKGFWIYNASNVNVDEVKFQVWW
jgi:hypothetical protein